jgi:hypothetical protein
MNNKRSFSLVAAVATATLAAGALFTWGMAVGNNDVQTFAHFDSQSEIAGRGVCGARGHLVRVQGHYLCVRMHEDGTAAAQPVFDSPIGAL